MDRVRVEVPATSANLGPGFDALGMALDLSNTVVVERASRLEIVVEGEGVGEVSDGEDNLVYRAMRAVYQRLGREAPGVKMQCHNRIPLARGLGSSAAAIVAGLVAANFLEGDPLTGEELLYLGTELDGHPDNVAPALLGGVQVCVRTSQSILHASVPVPPRLRLVLFVPDFSLSTAKARAVLPQMVPLGDAVYNVGRAALLVAALATGQIHLLREATRDALHQPAREELFPAMPYLLQAAIDAGALGAFLSGAGPTLAAFAAGNAEQVSTAFAVTARERGISGTTYITSINPEGARTVAHI